MNNLQVFENKAINSRIRCYVIDTSVWFIAGDLAKALEYAETSNMLQHCDESSILGDVNKINNLHPSTKWINEGDLYNCIFGSTKPEAKVFKKWVTSEVLPSIRKNGFYIDTDKNLTSLTDEQIYNNLQKKLREMSIELHKKMGCLFNTGNIAKKNLNNMEKSIIKLFNSTGTNVIDQKTIIDAIGRGDDDDGNDVMSSLDNLDMFGILLTNYDSNTGAVYHLIEHPAVN